MNDGVHEVTAFALRELQSNAEKLSVHAGAPVVLANYTLVHNWLGRPRVVSRLPDLEPTSGTLAAHLRVVNATPRDKVAIDAATARHLRLMGIASSQG